MTTATASPAMWFVGPLRVTLNPTFPAVCERVDEQLSIFSEVWETDDHYGVVLNVSTSATPAAMTTGTYLTCSRMNVDRTPDGGLYATTASGACARLGRCSAGGETWFIDVPGDLIGTPAIDELEDLVGLALVSGWYRAGWTPLHGGAVVRDGNALLLCAMSGGGKSTLTAAFVRNGWRTLGDDKLLLRSTARGTEVRALMHSFNLHPQTQRWFPEVGDLDRLPRYSAWTPKRKVRADEIWPGSTAARANVTHVVRVRRTDGEAPITVAPLGDDDVFRTLAGGIAIPKDRQVAGEVLATISRALRNGIRGLDIVIGEGAYRDPSVIAQIAAVL